MFDVDNLEIGKVYYVEVDGFLGMTHWLFKKDVTCPRTNIEAITSCRFCMRIDGNHCNYGGASHVCGDAAIKVLKPANPNYIAIWNRTFNDNIEIG